MRNLFKITVLLMTASVAFARNPKFGRDLDGVDPRSVVDVIVQFDHVPAQADHLWVRGQGGALRMPYRRVKAGFYRVPASSLKQLANNPHVTFISPDRPVKGKLDVTAATVNAPAAWQLGLDGTGIGVAIIDSGITEVNDLAGAASSTARILWAPARMIFMDTGPTWRASWREAAPIPSAPPARAR